MCVFITAVPIIKLFAWGKGDNGAHVLRETTSRDLSGLVCPSRTGTREEPSTLAQGVAVFSLVPLCVWNRTQNSRVAGASPTTSPSGEQSRIILPPETGEQPSLSSGWSDAPWLNRSRPGSLYLFVAR